MRIQNTIILSFSIALTFTSAASAQSALPTEAGVAISLQVGGQPYHFEGKAACHHAPVASIYNVMAEMWSLRQIDSQRAITLTLWRPKNMSGDMFLLSVQAGSKAYLINTVNAGRGNSSLSSGKVSFTASGAGGMFTINATAANGTVITGAIKCSAFTAAMAEGG